MTAAGKRSYGVVFLGASQFPHKPGLDNPAFAASKRAIAEVLTMEFLLADSVVYLDLFDNEASQADIAMRVDEFLRQQRHLTDLIFYYCGHGGFLTNRTYYLTLRSTRYAQEAVTGLVLNNFKMSLEDSLSNKRVYLLLDCCFAAAAVADWMADDGVPAVIRNQVEMAFPPSGAALLCATGKYNPAIAPKGDNVTLFSGHFVRTIRDGVQNRLNELSLDDIAVHLRDRILNEPTTERKVMPELHVTGLQKGDVSRLPLIRNRGVIKPEQPPSVTNFWSSPYTTIIQMAGYNVVAPQSPLPEATTATDEAVKENKGAAGRKPQPQPPNEQAKTVPDEAVTENKGTVGRKTHSARGGGGKKSPGKKGPTSKPVRDRTVNAPPSRGTKPKTTESVVPVSYVTRVREFLRDNRGPVATLAGAGVLFSIYLLLPSVRPPVSVPAPIPRLPIPAPTNLVPRANAFLDEYMRRASGPIDDFVAYAAANYEWTVRYYDKTVARDVVINDKKVSLGQWAKRSYLVNPDTLNIRCDLPEQACRLSGNLWFRLESLTKNVLSTGERYFEYRVVLKDGFSRIAEENGNDISRVDKDLRPPPPQPQPRVDLVAQANAFLEEFMRRASGPSDDFISYVSAAYQSSVLFYGGTFTRDQAIRDKQAEVSQWPKRSYLVNPDTVSINCEATEPTCRISGISRFRLESAARNLLSTGDASFEFRVVFKDNDPKIVEEKGNIFSKKVTDLNPPLPRIDLPPKVETVPPKSEPTPPKPVPPVDHVARANSFLEDYMRRASGTADDYMSYVSANYQSSVLYFGKASTRDQVIQSKQAHVVRWPQRSYRPKPETVKVNCEPSEHACRISGMLRYRAESPARNEFATGEASFEFRVVLKDNSVAISEEKGDVISRQTGELRPAPPPKSEVSSCVSASPPQTAAIGGPLVPVSISIEPDLAKATKMRSVRVSPDGSLFVTTGDDGFVRLWNATTLKLERILFRSPQSVGGIAFSNNGGLLAVTGTDGAIRVWTMSNIAADPVRLRDLAKPAGPIHSLAFAPNSSPVYLAAGFKSGRIEIWDVLQRKLRDTKTEPSAKIDPNAKIDPGSKPPPPPPIRSVSFPPDPSGHFVSAGQGTIWFHELGRGTAPLQAHAGGVSSVQYSPDGRSVLSVGHDGKLKLWDAAKRTLIRTSDAPDMQYIFAATWSRDGTRIASGGGDRKVSLWDATSLRRIRSFEGHKDDVEAVAFDASGKRIFSVSEDKTLKVWDAASGKELATIVPSGDAYLAYTPKGCYFGSDSADRLFKVIENGVSKDMYPELKRLLFMPQGFGGLMASR